MPKALFVQRFFISIFRFFNPLQKQPRALHDLATPAKVLGVSDRWILQPEDPLLTPHEQEREGYVPNVVYTCGALIHNNELVIPYAMSDIHSGFATVDVGNLIGCMQPVIE